MRDVADAELDRAAAHAGQAGDATVAAHLLAVGDALAAPLQSPETLGFDLEFRDVPAVVGDLAARAEAMQRFTEARAAYRRAGSPGGMAAADLRLAWLQRLADDDAAGVASCRRAVAGFTDAGDPVGLALALTHLAVADLSAGRLSAARAAADAAALVPWAMANGSRSYVVGCAAIVHATACSFRRDGRVEPALAAFDLACRIRRGVADHRGEWMVLDDLADLHDRLNSRGVSIVLCEEALERALSRLRRGPVFLPDWFHLTATASKLGKMVTEERDPAGMERLRELLESVLDLAPGGLVDTAAPTGDVVALLTRDRAGEPGSVFASAVDLDANMRRSVEQTAQSFHGWIALTEVLGPRRRADEAVRRGDEAVAERFFTEALAAAERHSPTQVAVILSDARRTDELDARADALLDATGDVDPEIMAQTCLLAGRPQRAAEVLAAAGLQDPPPVPPGWQATWSPCLLRARIARALGLHRDAAALAAQGVARFEAWFTAVTGDTYRIAVLDDNEVAGLYELAAVTAADDRDAAAALAAADRPRSLALAALVAESAALDGRTDARAAFAAWRRARAAWNGAVDRHRAVWRHDAPVRTRAERDREAAQRRLDAAADAVERVAPGLLDRAAAAPPPVSAAEVAAYIDADTAIVEYLLTDDELLTCVVTARGCRAVRTPVPVGRVVGAVRRVHGAWSGAQPPAPALEALLTQTLLGPVRGVLDDHRRIVVVPGGTLQLLPFHVLLDGGHVVSHVPAAALAPRLAGRPGVSAARSALVVGDPAADGIRRLSRLPGARVEALTVAGLWGVSALVGDEATGPRVRAGLGSGVLHLAAHGLLDPDAPDLSAVVLAGPDALTVAELHGLDTDLELAVLSACNSGRGDVTRGGDVVGLTRGLVAAGARHSVVAVWPVDDEVGCLVMTAFTEGITSGTPVAEALAGAVRRVRGTGTADRRAWFLDLAERAGVRSCGGRRDIAPAMPADAHAPEHPTWWAPFVHIGI